MPLAYFSRERQAVRHHASKLLTLVVILEKHDLICQQIRHTPWPRLQLSATVISTYQSSAHFHICQIHYSVQTLSSPQLYFSKVGYSFPLGARGFAVSALFGTPQRLSSRQLTFLLRRWGLSSMSRSFRRRNSPMSCGFYSGFGAGR